MLERLIDTPWKAATEVRRWILLPIARAYFGACGVQWGTGWRVYGLPLILRSRGSQIRIGDRLQIRNWVSSNPLAGGGRSVFATWARGAEIHIGEGVGLSSTVVCAERRVFIGDHVRLGARCVVVDTDFHPLDPDERKLRPTPGRAAPVTIENDVFIGLGTIVLKGAHIGAGTVIGAGSVVVGEIPPRVVAAGDPARVIRPL